MALIKCPECGKEISDKATNCINCGFPIAKQSLIRIKCPSFRKDFPESVRTTTTYFYNQDGSLIKSCIDNETFIINSDKPLNIHIEIKLSMAILYDYQGNYTVFPNKKYQIIMQRNIIGGWKSVSPILSEVEMIDAE